MDGDLKENVTRRSTWLRFCFMIIMGVAFSVAEVVVFAVVAFQFLSSLFTGETNDQLVRLGRNLARYLQQITAYLTFATEEVPFPFMTWPDEPHDDDDPEEAVVEEDPEIEEEEEFEEEAEKTPARPSPPHR